MKIIFLHGMNQQNYTADSLKEHWTSIFAKGIDELCLKVNVEQLNIVLPFYGDLMTKHQLSNKFDLDAFLPKSILNFHLNHHRAIEPDIQLSNLNIPELPIFTKTQILSLSTRLYLASQFAKDIALKEFFTILNNFPKLQESLIHKFLIETYMYLTCSEFMQEVNQRVLESLEEGEEHIIVSHSLGTVIAYNLLQQLDPKFCIQRFITLGSPLAFRMIQCKVIHPIIHPKSLCGDWYNFYSDDDFLTAFPLIEAPFNFRPAIRNKKISTFTNMPHKIVGYLQHPAVIKCILEPILKPTTLKPCHF
ncbi:hypothetical protein [Acinetobacter sp. ANC 4648]|uniref:hypothetical protein n=1 Tax=Acinetobacter sp. ANC 4648 TaxID=1977875 RepID=UPI000A33F438|nr:hypothetical protein [Acinetobacter sp. ANC 4648]OTG81696.1 hypothetical protein B9T27_10535 [Acinetobacter sp. ANC 4648]